jgi:hypothetical protein
MDAMADSIDALIVDVLNQRGILVPDNEVAELAAAYRTLVALERVLESMVIAATQPAFIAPADLP